MRRAPGKYLVGPERFTVTVDDGCISAAPGWRLLGAKLELEVMPDAIVQLFDGSTTVEQLVARDVLRIKAEPDALLAFDDATRAIAHAAIASHELQMEFERYRAWVWRFMGRGHPDEPHAEHRPGEAHRPDDAANQLRSMSAPAANPQKVLPARPSRDVLRDAAKPRK